MRAGTVAALCLKASGDAGKWGFVKLYLPPTKEARGARRPRKRTHGGFAEPVLASDGRLYERAHVAELLLEAPGAQSIHTGVPLRPVLWRHRAHGAAPRG